MPPTTLSAFHLSPKRKRDQPPPIPHINTALRPASPPPKARLVLDGSESPRNGIADQLRGMSLTHISAIPMSPLSPSDQVVRKKPKLDEMQVESGTSLAEHLSGIANSRTFDSSAEKDDATSKPSHRGSRDVAGTPEARTQPRILSDIAALAQPTAFVSSSTTNTVKKSKALAQGSGSASNTLQPRRRAKSPSPPLSVLTWQDSEITGHLTGPTNDPDDDGTGLNGIGFRPTPAIAYVRAQKRRQQILDWKAREAREARAKRSERRRRGVGALSSREPTVERDMSANMDFNARRTVKFAI